MQRIGVFASQFGVADDGILLDALQASGLAHAVAFLHVLEDGDYFSRGFGGRKKNLPFGFTKALFMVVALNLASFRLAHTPAQLKMAQPAHAKTRQSAILT